MREFAIAESARGESPLLIGLMGPPGGGKTFSALRLASGICKARGGKPFVIDTEKRSRKYADFFDFERVDFDPPFKPEDFLAAITFCVERGAGAIIVDSASDEHEGAGGVLDWHDTELERMAGSDWQKRERVGQAAWIKPKASRRRLIDGMLRVTVPLILCFRAREKVKQIKNERGKMEPTNIGYQPIAPLEIVHALDLVCLLPPRAEGVPVWRSDKIGEDFMIKLPAFLQPFIRDGEALSEGMGEAFANWARGGIARPLIDRAADTAALGREALKDFYRRLTQTEQKSVADADWKRLFAGADAADAARSQNAADDPPVAKDAGAERPATAPASDRLAAIRAIAAKGMDAVHDWRETASADDLALFDDHASEIFTLATVADQKNAAA